MLTNGTPDLKGPGHLGPEDVRKLKKLYVLVPQEISFPGVHLGHKQF